MPAPRPVPATLLHAGATLAGIAAMALVFAHVEIQIEGPAGWAASLPTWRVEKHWALDLFWGGRPMTGYHAWVFGFLALAFHWHFLLHWQWSWRLEARVLGSLALFWILEDLLWFVCNKDFGWQSLVPERVWWHKHWLLGLPADYWILGLAGLLLFAMSWTGDGRRQ